MPPLPDYKSQISFGNLMQIGTMLVVLALGWSALDARSQAATATLSDHEARLRTLERDVISGITRIEQRLIQLERRSPP